MPPSLRVADLQKYLFSMAHCSDLSGNMCYLLQYNHEWLALINIFLGDAFLDG